MNDLRRAYVGLDTGDMLTLLAFWTHPGAGGPESLEPTWPVRAPVETFHATTAGVSAEIQRAIQALCAEHGRRPEDCFLVRLGGTQMQAACQIAAAVSMHGLIDPKGPCVLWSEGVLPSRHVREYVRSVPGPAAMDLGTLRACFAELMEQASEDLQGLELDQDDSLLDRLIDVRYKGHEEMLTVPVESLTDPDRLLRPFHMAHAARFSRADENAPVEVLTARLRCIVVTFYRPDRAAVSAGPETAPQAGWTRQILSGGHTLWTSSQTG